MIHSGGITWLLMRDMVSWCCDLRFYRTQYPTIRAARTVSLVQADVSGLWLWFYRIQHHLHLCRTECVPLASRCIRSVPDSIQQLVEPTLDVITKSCCPKLRPVGWRRSLQRLHIFQAVLKILGCQTIRRAINVMTPWVRERSRHVFQTVLKILGR